MWEGMWANIVTSSLPFMIKRKKLIESEVFKDMFDSILSTSPQSRNHLERIDMTESSQELNAILPWFESNSIILYNLGRRAEHLQLFWFWTLVDKYSLKAAAKAICDDIM